MYRAFVANDDPFLPDTSWCDITRHVLELAMGIYSEIHERDKILSDTSSGGGHGPYAWHEE
jgi:hypothetical protein